MQPLATLMEHVVQQLHRQDLPDQHHRQHTGIADGRVLITGLLDGKLQHGGLGADHAAQETEGDAQHAVADHDSGRRGDKRDHTAGQEELEAQISLQRLVEGLPGADADARQQEDEAELAQREVGPVG